MLICPFKIRHCACLAEKREKDIRKVRWLIYHLSTIEDCNLISLGGYQFSKFRRDFLKESIEGECNAPLTAFLMESCRQVSETCHNMRHRMVTMRYLRFAAACALRPRRSAALPVRRHSGTGPWGVSCAIAAQPTATATNNISSRFMPRTPVNRP